MPPRPRRTGQQQGRVLRQGSGPVEGGTAQPIAIRIYWDVPDELPTLFSNHIFVSEVDGQFTLTFGRAHLPYELRLTEEMVERMRNDGLPARAIARIAVSPESMGKYIEAMSLIYQQWRDRQTEAVSSQQGGQ